MFRQYSRVIGVAKQYSPTGSVLASRSIFSQFGRPSVAGMHAQNVLIAQQQRCSLSTRGDIPPLTEEETTLLNPPDEFNSNYSETKKEKMSDKDKDEMEEQAKRDARSYIQNVGGFYEHNETILRASGHLESQTRKKFHAAWVANFGSAALEYRMGELVQVAIDSCGSFNKALMDQDHDALEAITSPALFRYMKKNIMNEKVKLEAMDFHENGGYRVDNIGIREIRGRTQDKHEVLCVEAMLDCMVRLKVTIDDEIIMPGEDMPMSLGMSFVSRLPSDGEKIDWKIYGVETLTKDSVKESRENLVEVKN